MKQIVHAVLYTKPHCIQCKMSTKLMDELGLPYENTYYGNSEETNSIELIVRMIVKDHGVNRK